ncbi:HAD hydrolase-like protein [Sphingomonas sp. S1-29]|uniref:HAD hydrolase-like protein n=1 Tax=Sphingomonas sp. S1-29 TaxID=2991074 RepID=UPI00223F3AA3|nr:HAD hydrolase-like protein [Sphingomonas sp. S1-29]UZK69256.1 HAD hydrolase-like protein [Sphingomonas sp. S1-29]
MTVPDADAGAPIRLVIFDFDGTLSDSGGWFLGIVDHLAEKYRFRAVDPDEVEGMRDKTTREVIRHLGIPPWKLPFIARYVRSLLALHTHEIALFEGIAELLAALKAAGIRVAVVTSNSELNARRILGPDNAALVDVWECASSLYGKAPKYRRALKRAGVAASEAISIGDETRDIEAARRAGMRAGAVLWGYASESALRAQSPDLVFAAPNDIARMLIAGDR